MDCNISTTKVIIDIPLTKIKVKLITYSLNSQVVAKIYTGKEEIIINDRNIIFNYQKTKYFGMYKYNKKIKMNSMTYEARDYIFRCLENGTYDLTINLDSMGSHTITIN